MTSISKNGICILLIFWGGFCTPAYADNPCTVVGMHPDFNPVKRDFMVCEKAAFGHKEQAFVSDYEILAKLSNQLSAQHAEIVGLRADLKVAITQLAAAVDALAKVGNNLVAQNLTWQSQTLKETISSIDRMPVVMAENPVLVTSLKQSLKSLLVADPEFIEDVAKAKAEARQTGASPFHNGRPLLSIL